ncbi:MAG: hypothetical protein AB1757_16240 [Acidobacteriota bacterium]
MESSKENTEIKEYADGWITERKGTDVPMFLKFAFIVIAGGCLTYLFLYMNGEETHSDRGTLVRAFNEVTGTTNGFMYFVAALGIIYGAILVRFTFKKFHED